MKYGIITKWQEMDGYEYDEHGEHRKIKERTVLTIFPDYDKASDTFSDIADLNDDETIVRIIWEGFINEIKEIKS